MSTPSHGALAAPTSPAFVLAYAIWTIALASLATLAVIFGSKGGVKPGLLLYWIVPILLVLTARWAGRSTGVGMLLRRSVTAHILSTAAASVLVAIASQVGPGASGHGGAAGMLVFLLPMSVVLASLVGLVAGGAAYAVARRLASQVRS